MPTLSRSLEHEIGAPSRIVETGHGGWRTILDDVEDAPELRWPLSLAVWDRMRRTDGQTCSVLRAITLPIRQASWRLVGGDPMVRALCEAQLGLQLDDLGRRRRSREGISFDEFLRHALLMLPLGFMPFEQIYRIAPPPPGFTSPRMPALIAHLRKLAPRMPRSITRFDLARDGGLLRIWQIVTGDHGYPVEVPIPIDSLVYCVNEKEGADWLGTSLLRASYAHWLIKTHLMRLDAIAGERQSMGFPVVSYDENGSATEALKLGSKARAGEEAAMAEGPGYKFRLEGISGSVVDLLPKIEYHDQAIGRNALAMFLNLGHDAGARSLGETFVDFFLLSVKAVVSYLEEIITEHVIRDLVALNFGPDEPYPTLVAGEIDGSGAMSHEALRGLVEAGVILPDDDLEAYLRRRAGLPPSMRSLAMGPGASPTEIVIDGPSLPPPIQAGYSGLEVIERRLATVNEQLAARRATLDRMARRALPPAVPAA